MTIDADPETAGFNPIQQFQEVAGDIRDPYPFINDLREQCPVMGMNLAREMGQTIDANAPKMPPMYTAFNYEYVNQVLTQADTYSSSGYELFMGPVMGHTILEMDAPEHSRHRVLVAGAFRPKVIEQWRETTLEPVANEMVEAVAGNGRADLVTDLTFPFPLTVMAKIMGLPHDDWPKFHQWSMELISVAQDWNRALGASKALADYFSAIIADRRKQPRDDLISRLVVAQVDGETLTDEQIMPFLRLLLPAGIETTYRSTGNLLYGLLTHPDQLDALRNDRSLLPQAIEEGLRWEPPLLFITRSPKCPVMLGGESIPEGAQVAVSMAGGNRDPQRWDNPDEFDIFRERKSHLSFGAGPHLCLGQHLARAETTAMINAVLDRLPNVRLDPDADDPHIHGLSFRSPTSLPVLFDS
ncbi:MAG TPA: cytochrome P450 [Mycobacteriales bacterium]|jgi:cytochrome P450|nr:cytochrome P450 [Mycobacteriales bacterium]